MQLLKESEWIFLNEITHMIHDTRDLDEMRSTLMEQLSVLIPYHGASFYLANHQKDSMLYAPLAINIDQRDVSNYLEYGEKLDYTMPIFKRGKPLAYRETDLFDPVMRESSEFFNDFLAHGNEYPLALCIAKDSICYGALSLYRSRKMGDFSERDVFILRQLHDHLATKITQTSKNYNDISSDKLHKLRQDHQLTAREVEILEYLLNGATNQEISEVLMIELGTVKRHASNIYYKLQVQNRLQLIKTYL